MKKLITVLFLGAVTTVTAQTIINEQVHRQHGWKTTTTVNAAAAFVSTIAMERFDLNRGQIFALNMGIGATLASTFEAVNVHYYGYKFDPREASRAMLGTLTGYAIGQGIVELQKVIDRRKSRPKLML